jgi:hypothetical protein
VYNSEKNFNLKLFNLVAINIDTTFRSLVDLQTIIPYLKARNQMLDILPLRKILWERLMDKSDSLKINK